MFFAKNLFFFFQKYIFSKLHFCCFTFKYTLSCSFKYFESSDVIVVKKESLLAFVILMF